jgi:hypothetical protein
MKMKDSLKKILVLVILLVAVVAATVLLSRSQETRRGAYFDQSKIVLLGSGDIEVGEEEIVQVKAYGLAEGTKITAFDLSFLVEGSGLLIRPEDIEVESVFGVILRKEIESLGTNSHRVWVTGYTMESKEDIPGAGSSGVLSLFKFKLQALEEGEVRVIADPDRLPDLAGWNPDENSNDMDILVGSVEELTFSVGEGQLIGDGPRFNFTIRFSGINQDTQYNEESEVDVIMVDNTGKKYFYRNVPVSSTKAGNGTYKGSMILSKFPKGEKNYALIKGPKHLQSKYCVDGQNGICDTVGGGLAFGDAYEEKVYNFGGWMILAGDLPDADMVQDEVVDVADYTRLVNALPLDKRSDPEMVKRNDINGNNMVETLDLDALLETLSTKYGALY